MNEKDMQRSRERNVKCRKQTLVTISVELCIQDKFAIKNISFTPFVGR